MSPSGDETIPIHGPPLFRVLALLATFAGTQLMGDSLPLHAQEPQDPDTLTRVERDAAARVADEAVQPYRTAAPMYLVDFDLIRPKESGEARQALVTHYRYDGDLAIFTTVDLARAAPIAVDTVPHLPVRLAAEEVANAERLALASPEVQRALAQFRDELRVEALQTRPGSPDDPLFGHRVVRLLFRTSRGYLEEPIVFVDLTAERVLIEEGEGR